MNWLIISQGKNLRLGGKKGNKLLLNCRYSILKFRFFAFTDDAEGGQMNKRTDQQVLKLKKYRPRIKLTTHLRLKFFWRSAIFFCWENKRKEVEVWNGLNTEHSKQEPNTESISAAIEIFEKMNFKNSGQWVMRDEQGGALKLESEEKVQSRGES